jgi:hypothetical protein
MSEFLKFCLKIIAHRPEDANRRISKRTPLIASSILLTSFVLFCCSSTSSPENGEDVLILFPGVLPDTAGITIKPISTQGPVTFLGTYQTPDNAPYRILIFKHNDYDTCYASASFTSSHFSITGLPKDTVDVIFIINDFWSSKETNLVFNSDLASYYGIRTGPVDPSSFFNNELVANFKYHLFSWRDEYLLNKSLDEIDMPEDVRLHLKSLGFTHIRRAITGEFSQEFKNDNDHAFRRYRLFFNIGIDLNSLLYVQSSLHLKEYIKNAYISGKITSRD